MRLPHQAAGIIKDCPTKAAHAHRQIEIGNDASGLQFEPYQRQHVEDDADGQEKLRRDTKERTNENLTRQH